MEFISVFVIYFYRRLKSFQVVDSSVAPRLILILSEIRNTIREILIICG